MRQLHISRLVIPALAVLALACDAHRSTAPRDDGAAAADAWSGERAANAPNTTIVLIHGAWADGTGWQEVIPLLQKEGYRVVAVQNPLISLPGDVETTKRAIERQTAQGRDVIAVAHSYGGAVMSGAAAGNPRVRALVYVAAFAPDAGERGDAFFAQYPSDILSALEPPDPAGFLYLSEEMYRPVFAGDLPERRTRVMQASQKPLNGAIFGQSNPVAAWRTIPSWFIVAKEDRVINPDLERFYARRMNAHTTEIDASHVVFISHPHEVARIILAAASATP